MKLDPAYRSDFAALKQAAQSDFLATLGVYGTFPEQLRRVMPKDAIWVRDVTQSNTTWGNRIFPVYSPHQSVFPVGAGIGQGLSLGLGAAAAANGRKTVVMTGDGGFFLNVGELWTAVQENLDLSIIVMNDRGYGVIKRIQDATAQGRRFFADLQGPDLGQLAALAGIPVLEGAECRCVRRNGGKVDRAQGAESGGGRYDRGRRIPRLLSVQPTPRRLIARCAACWVWPRCWPSPGC